MPNNDSCNLNVIHSNCQSAMNKRSEIHDLVNYQQPHILALTEFGAAEDIRTENLESKVIQFIAGITRMVVVDQGGEWQST